MALTFFDPVRGEARAFTPKAVNKVGVGVAPGAGAREKIVAEGLCRALAFLGLVPRQGREILVGGGAPPASGVWLKVGGVEALPKRLETELAARFFSVADFEFYCLLTHYGAPLRFSWAALADASHARKTLVSAGRALGGVDLEPSSRGRAGYLHRFRECLGRDLDLPGAISCVFDGLKPGALSPGSRAPLLREAAPVILGPQDDSSRS